jgi:hypothetical protein
MKQKMKFKNEKLSNNGNWKGDELFNRICKLCGEFTKLCKENDRPIWYRYDNGFICYFCYQRRHRKTHPEMCKLAMQKFQLKGKNLLTSKK